MLKTAKNFTFHSGTILIPNLSSQNDASFAFTFHSGTILIVGGKNVSFDGYDFTFHSGTILIERALNNREATLLYIPLWYDSNKKIVELTGIDESLYIPLWYDSNNGCQT